VLIFLSVIENIINEEIIKRYKNKKHSIMSAFEYFHKDGIALSFLE
jgi:hypothetical protein